MNENSHPDSAPQRPTEAEIREHAYRLYEEGGRAPGRDWENWLKAEADLTARWEAAWPVPPKWAWHHRTLLQIRDTLRAEREEHAQALRLPLPQGDGADVVDVANDACEHGTLLAEISLEDAELAEVEAALERIRNGTYGRCEVTGQPIPAARLRALPWTRRTLAAATDKKSAPTS